MIRRYTPEDEAACLALIASNIPAYFTPGDADEFRHFLRGCGDYFVTVIDGEVRACGGCYVNENGVGGLTWGMVHSVDHRRGLGSELLRHRLEMIRRTPYAWCVLLNTTQSVAPFFERFGFRTFRTIDNGYGPGLHTYSMRLLWVTE
ncbi:GNAT family N-acetyltransferase [Zavarzinella formosa]|uniref:GNAT family N-acetyltransferase n=1 Tax=Zavarzinella formosa TaxID=360055 RepID=UPI0002FC866E|nr:GNAT family N-acetyltransferase [Zavarzinella formosa]